MKRNRGLSKSKLLSYLQCPKRLWLEVHRPELVHYSPQTEAAFATGHEVGAVARRIYGNGAGVLIGMERGLSRALTQTHHALHCGSGEPLFEATFEYEGVLVRTDVMIPDGAAYRIVEVKASTSIKDEHVVDCAIQGWVLAGAGVEVTSISLAHIDNEFVYPGGEDYTGLLREQDFSAEIQAFAEDVPGWVQAARSCLAAGEPEVAVGRHCFRPYECPLAAHCWGSDTEFPVSGLGGSKDKLAELANAGFRDIRDVPAERLSHAGHRRIHAVTVRGKPELMPGAHAFAESLGYPRYYLDFETIAPPVPAWAGTRPYETLPVQYSCHVEQRTGEVRHSEFLDLSGAPPMRALAEGLISDLGDAGPVLMYTSYEKTVINGLIERFPDLAAPLAAIVERLVDMQPPIKQNYYHPAMLGSWSIKALLPAAVPEMRYDALQGITEGNAASRAYLEAIRADTAPERKAEIEEQLRAYCRFDTEAMLRLVQFFQSSTQDSKSAA